MTFVLAPARRALLALLLALGALTGTAAVSAAPATAVPSYHFSCQTVGSVWHPGHAVLVHCVHGHRFDHGTSRAIQGSRLWDRAAFKLGPRGGAEFRVWVPWKAHRGALTLVFRTGHSGADSVNGTVRF